MFGLVTVQEDSKGPLSKNQKPMLCLDLQRRLIKDQVFTSGLHHNDCHGSIQSVVCFNLVVEEGLRYRLDKGVNVPMMAMM